MNGRENVFPRAQPPCYIHDDDADERCWERQRAGMDVRTFIATMAMQGILAGIEFFAKSKIKTDGGGCTLSVTKLAVDTADALIAELSKNEKGEIK